jgi:hypothetical protein
MEPGQEPDKPPDEECGEEGQDRFVPQRDPEISGGTEDSQAADDEGQLADVQGCAGEMDICEGLVE